MSTKDVSTLRIAPKVWRNGEFIDWDDARVHVMTHAIHYGSSVFEGIRCLRDQARSSHLSSDRTHAKASEFRQNLPDGNENHARRALPGDG